MEWTRPEPDALWRAIDGYLSVAYDGKPPPAAVRTRLDALKSVTPDQLYNLPTFERAPAAADGAPDKLSLRLGNKFYPHMKLVVERSPDGAGHLFRADAHDRHCCPPPTSKEYPLFCKLMEDNQHVCQAIESAWERADLPTFKQYLKRDLARRMAAHHPANAHASPPTPPPVP